MKLKQLTIFKSKTVGHLDANGKTRFKKLQFEAVAEIEEGKDPDAEYEELSDYISKCMDKEVKR